MKKLKILLLAAALSVLAIGACSTGEHQGQMTFADEQAPGDYNEILHHWTNTAKGYSSDHQSFGVTATLLTSEVVTSQVYRQAQDDHWTDDEYKIARDKALYDLTSEATFFISFYTYSDDQNDLDKSNSIWNVFVNLGGRRVSPTSIKRAEENKDLLKSKYPFLTPWDRNYYVTFPVPAREMAAGPTALNLASVIGTASLNFPK